MARIPARRSELASMMGLTTETLCRAVAKLRRQGSIRTLDHDIVVQNPEALRELVNRPRR